MIKGILFYTFGLKEEWLKNFLNEGISFINSNNLGPKQEAALVNYLKKIELLKRNEATEFFNLIKSFYNTNFLLAWSFIWVNLYINSELFAWWGKKSLIEYKRYEILQEMVSDAGIHNKSIDSGLNSLISTFEYTPIGSDLKIGIVTRNGRERSVKKEGGFPFDGYAILYAIYKLAERIGKYDFTIEELREGQYSPQKILLISDDYIRKKLLAVEGNELLDIVLNDDIFLIKLNNQKLPIDVLKFCLNKEEII